MVRRTTTSTTTTTTLNNNITPPKKKKGRPSLVDLQNRALLQQQQRLQQQQNPNSQSHFPQSNPNNNLHRRSRSARRIPNLPGHFIDGSDSDDHSGPNSVDSDHSDEDDYDEEDDDDDDERAEKKVKLVVQFPNSSSDNKKKFINAVAQDEKGSKATDNENGTRMLGALEHGPTTSTATATSTPLPDKKLLLLILDKLQKKDTRGVFAEPVDPEELPDYHEIIEKPMDFETVRKKLLGGRYSILEQLEDDINLICSNAMEYNAPSTIFFRQARAIQDLAKKEFDTLRQDGGLSEAPTKPRRGRPPGSRNLKKLLESSPPDRSVRESSSDATPASREEDATRSGSYNLRKGPSLYRFPRYLENCFDFSASSSKSMSVKYGKKPWGSEEGRRDTYLSGDFDSGQGPQLFTNGGLEKQLIAVGLGPDHSYARSLARFGTGLGPAAWKIVSKKIASVLPPGVEFGPGWVEESKLSSTKSNCVSSEPHNQQTSSFISSNISGKPPTSSFGMLESQELSSNVDWSSSFKGGNDNGVVGTGPWLQIQHQNSVYPRMNGFNGSFAPGSQFQDAMARSTPLLYNNPYALDSSSSFDASRSFHGVMNTEDDMLTHGMPYWQNLSMQENWDNPFQPERLTASGSKGLNLPIGSPPQLDLVLQL